MVNRSKAKGTAAETRVVNFLLAAGLRANRVVMKGQHDQGDVHILHPNGCVHAVLEVKGGRQTANISRQQQEDWLTETRIEVENVGNVRGYLVIAKHGSSVKDYHVWSAYGQVFWYLDQFADFAAGGYQ
jgi:hypothetical protein